MLKRIEAIEGIGLLHQADGSRHSLERGTFIYSDNGRGKSTLASVLRAVTTSDISLLKARETIDGTLAPKVLLQFENGHKISFSNGAWTNQYSEILVFDEHFVEKNVFSGSSVNTDHRKNLLEFALGEAAVTARNRVDEATTEGKNENDKLKDLNDQLSKFHQGMAFSEFERLSFVDDIKNKLIDLEKRINAAHSKSLILNQPIPIPVPMPILDIEDIFKKLSISLENIHANAEDVFKKHFLALGSVHIEGWISQGLQFGNNEFCPYCGQNTRGNDLLRAYQCHFNVEYNNLRTEIERLSDSIRTGTASIIAENFSQKVKIATAQAASWAEHVSIQPLNFETETVCGDLNKLKALLLGLLQKKQVSLSEPIGTEVEKAEANILWTKIISIMNNINSSIKEADEAIISYKNKLETEDVTLLHQETDNLKKIECRYSENIIKLITQLNLQKDVVKQSEEKKRLAREFLNGVMKETLEKYEKSVNKLLNDFGATFSIKGMSGNFRGSAPRSEYGLLLRGKDVGLQGGSPSFANVLSESDKRTLAFSFFIASALEDSKLSSRIVVIDDPMCSLDQNRRNHTKIVLKEVYSKAKQLIVLAHDLYFLRDLQESIQLEDNTAKLSALKLAYSDLGYTDFEKLDIEKECESDYFRNHGLVNDFIIGQSGDVKLVAQAIRPMLEGFLHRRFPRQISKKLKFGEIIRRIGDSAVTSPLHHAKNLVPELNQINEYAWRFHHDTNPNASTAQIVETELRTYAQRAVDLIYKCY